MTHEKNTDPQTGNAGGDQSLPALDTSSSDTGLPVAPVGQSSASPTPAPGPVTGAAASGASSGTPEPLYRYAPQVTVQSPQPGSGVPAYAPPVTTVSQRNVVGIIGFIAALVGAVFACIPGAFIIGWVLLPVGFILSLVGVCLPKKAKWFSIAGLVVSVVGTVLGVVVFFATAVDAIDEAFGGETIAVEPDAAESAETADEADVPEDASDAAEEVEDDAGSRANPHPIGTAVSQGDWTVTVNEVKLDATQDVLEGYEFNEAPAEGNEYILVNITATYDGIDENGAIPLSTVEYVTKAGNTINTYDTFVIAPEPFDQVSTLYPGASTTGNLVFEVPSKGASKGVLAVQPDMLGDKAFVALK